MAENPVNDRESKLKWAVHKNQWHDDNSKQICGF